VSEASARDVVMDLVNKKILVVGLGKSGLAAAQVCAARGARVTVTDRRSEGELAGALASLPAEVRRELGGHRNESFTEADLVVVSPGVPMIPPLAAAARAGVKIVGELELASWFLRGTIVAITGTNGKSTTTSLCGAMLRATGAPTFVGGNLGDPLAGAVGTPAGDAGGYLVVEVSSFQAETIETFHPRVAVFLNLTADHLDRYEDLDGYAAAKMRIFHAQGAGDFAVFNADDPVIRRHVESRRPSLRSRQMWFSRSQALNEGAWLNGETLCVRLPGGDVETYSGELPFLTGRHNRENALAALLAARLVGATPGEVRRSLLAFRPLAHRMELVAEYGGVAYYDDSKGTNVGAVVAALDGFPRPVVLIAGGRDKGGDYAPMSDVLSRVGRAVVLIGEAADKIAASLAERARHLPVFRAASMEDAVVQASRVAASGDAVVLSPACSSFDMFRDYSHRAEVFRAAVERLVGREGML
jgi:UDP-N-acetylmuramoylalanine--D-glutamate ligase